MLLDESKIRKFIPSSLLEDYGVIETQEEIALDKYLKPVLGGALITRIKSQNADTNRDALLPYVERPLAYFTYLDCVDLMDLVHTEAGFAVMQNSNMTPASKDRVAKFKNGIARNAYDGLEALLEYLEEKAADFTEWQESDTYKEIQAHFIDSASEFDQYVRIGRNRRTFLAMLPHMGDVETFRIEPIVKDQFAALLNGTAEANVKELLPYVKGAVANLAMGKALDVLVMNVSANGLTVAYALGKNKPPEESSIKKLQRAYFSEGEKYLSKLQQEYDLLFPDTEREAPYENDQSNVFVA